MLARLLLGIVAIGWASAGGPFGGAFVNAAIVAPPWSNPSNNPCASLPGGWQLLYWAPLQKCFKIFTKGYPCPDTMELSPVGPSAPRTSNSRAAAAAAAMSTSSPLMSAECRCPPGTALSDRTGRCHTLFEREPCEGGEYFAPMPELPVRSPIPRKRIGQCKAPGRCAPNKAFWPPDGRCYTLRTRGPCARGKLVRAVAVTNVAADFSPVAECVCENSGVLASHYYGSEGTCHEHYTRGPCEGAGQLFLPGGQCGCHVRMPHYDDATDRCYEIGTIGPCAAGHTFVLPEEFAVDDSTAGRNDTSTSTSSSAAAVAATSVSHARCQCKEGYVPWSDGRCYRTYTRGPCADGEFVLNATSCQANPCPKGRLYFPAERTCYRIGTQGPCNWQQVVVFDFTTRPSLDGISYNGVCGCVGLITNLDQQCSSSGGIGGGNAADDAGSATSSGTGTGYESACAATAGMVELDGECYKLYSRGPCGPGQWLEPQKLASRADRRGVQCACRPNYTKYESADGLVGCYAPSVSIARWIYNLFGYNST